MHCHLATGTLPTDIAESSPGIAAQCPRMCHAHMRVESPGTVDGDDTVIVVAAEGTSGTELTETRGRWRR